MTLARSALRAAIIAMTMPRRPGADLGLVALQDVQRAAADGAEADVRPTLMDCMVKGERKLREEGRRR